MTCHTGACLTCMDELAKETARASKAEEALRWIAGLPEWSFAREKARRALADVSSNSPLHWDEEDQSLADGNPIDTQKRTEETKS